MKARKLYIVVPCYNEEAVLPETTKRLTALTDRMISDGLITTDSRILYVDDGSKDKTWTLIEQYHQADSRFEGVKLAANAGHQNALMAGLDIARRQGDIMVSVDADLQDDIDMIAEMVRLYDEGYDIVYGVRRKRTTDTFFKRTTAIAFYRLMRQLGVKSVYNHADYRLMSRRAVDQLCNYRERNLFLRGIVPLIGYRSTCVYYDRTERFAGESKYPLGKMVSFAVDGITSFSIRPLHLLFHTGLVFILIAVLIFIYVIYRYVTDDVVPGWSSIILSIWFVGGCILVGLGVVGEYIGKIYIEVKDRPRYNIEETLVDCELPTAKSEQPLAKS